MAKCYMCIDPDACRIDTVICVHLLGSMLYGV
jgi:hypothetical protein